MSQKGRDDELMDYLADLLLAEPETADLQALVVIPVSVLPDQPVSMAEPLNDGVFTAMSVAANIPNFGGLPLVFDCLQFRVGPFRLGLPLLGISSVHVLDQKMHILPGMQSWIIGIVQLPRERLCVVDLLSLFPVNEAATSPPEKLEAMPRMLVLRGSRWALAVHEIIGVQKLARADVRWRRRSESGVQSWYLGTIASDLCLLLDPGALQRQLERMLQATASVTQTD